MGTLDLIPLQTMLDCLSTVLLFRRVTEFPVLDIDSMVGSGADLYAGCHS
jgi:hypothetical protein